MPPTVGLIKFLLAKAPKVIREAAKSASKVAKQTTVSQPIPILARATTRQPIHPAAFLRQSKRYLSTRARLLESIRQFSTSGSQNARHSGSSRFASHFRQSTGRLPFASTLRPSLTGGALPRSAGGYSLGGGGLKSVRYFSHTPEAPAQVIHNVSQGLRAFITGGKKVQFDGVDRRTGVKRFKAVSDLQDKATKKINAVPQATPGSFIDFSVNPTITALTPLSSVAGYQAANIKTETLQSEGLLDILTVDFSRALQEITLVISDLKALSGLGDLPISYQNSKLRVHFPGVDPETVERLADELGIRRGVVGQDPDFDDFVGTEIALLFPFASTESDSQSNLPSPQMYNQRRPADGAYSSPTTLSDTDLGYEDLDRLSNPSYSSPSEFETVPSHDFRSSEFTARRPEQQSPLEYQDFEGIYRFIELCDTSRR